MKTKWIILSMLIVVLTSCNTDKNAKLQSLKAEYSKLGNEIKELEAELKISDKKDFIKLTFLEIKKTTFNHYIELQGKIDGDDNVIATAQAPGVIVKLNVKEGDNVQKGQILAEIDNQILTQTLAELKSQLEFVNDIYNKQKALWDKNIGSEVQYLTAKNNKESLENKMKTLNQQIDMYRITAPISGTIEEAPLKIGQSIAPGMIAFRVINFSKVKLVAEVSEAYANIIKKGNIIKVKFPDDKIEINAKIDFTSRFINPINRTFTIESFLKPGEAEYRANMMAVLNILDYTNSQAYVIPINYIQNDAKSQFVWVAEKQGNKYFAKKRAVTQGKSYNGLTEITNGLVEGDKLITSNLFNLLENEEVKL